MAVGHLFVMLGDLHRLDCDGWLLPTDAKLRIEPWARPAFEGLPTPRAADAPADWHDVRRAMRVDRPESPPVWLTDVGADEMMPIGWYVDGVRQFVADASRFLADGGATVGPSAREPARARPLLGLPIVATGRGGMAQHPDRVLLDLVPELLRLARDTDVDLVLVTPDRLKYDAAQAARRHVSGTTAPHTLTGESVDAARRLGQRIRAGQVGLFVGAGISMGAGLPGWRELLVAMTERLEQGELAGELASVLQERRLDPLDVASLLATRLAGGADALRAVVAELIGQVRRHSLAHGLLASLAVERTVTTNYDQLLESAMEGTGQPLAVLPYTRPAPHQPWLLKLHGDIGHRADIVLTRQDFLRYAADRNALTGVVHALLLTQHLMFVGYSLSDPNFHRVIDEVRRALSRAGETGPDVYGTVLVAEPPPAPIRELWGRDLDVIAPTDGGDAPAAFRDHDIWLDTLAMHASDPDAHLLSPRFAELLDEQQRAMRAALEPLVATFESGRLTGSAAEQLRELLTRLGWRPTPQR